MCACIYTGLRRENMSYKHSAAVRKYLRDRTRRYRAKKALAKQFKPRIMRFELCSLCHQWHPTSCILPSGHIIMMTLDRYHDKFEIDNLRQNIERLLKLDQGDDPQNAMLRCIQWRMESEGEDEEAARSNCELLFEDEQARQRWEDKLERDSYIQTQQEICTRSRMELYHEERDTAESNCRLILDDPLYRHMPPGLIPPLDIEDLSHGQIVTGGSVPEIEQKKNIMQCFFHQVEVEKMDPEEAMKFCSERARGKLSEEEEPHYTVGDTYGKTKEQILKEQAAEKEQDGLTVGNLFGQSREERLKKQRETRGIASSSPTATLKGRGSLPRRRRKPFFAVDELSDHTALVNEREERAREEHRKLVAAQSKKKLGEGK